ncbi:hypothetical protein MY5147_005132 [Beauveria neobassiana]
MFHTPTPETSTSAASAPTRPCGTILCPDQSTNHQGNLAEPVAGWLCCWKGQGPALPRPQLAQPPIDCSAPPPKLHQPERCADRPLNSTVPCMSDGPLLPQTESVDFGQPGARAAMPTEASGEMDVYKSQHNINSHEAPHNKELPHQFAHMPASIQSYINNSNELPASLHQQVQPTTSGTLGPFISRWH